MFDSLVGGRPRRAFDVCPSKRGRGSRVDDRNASCQSLLEPGGGECGRCRQVQRDRRAFEVVSPHHAEIGWCLVLLTDLAFNELVPRKPEHGVHRPLCPDGANLPFAYRAAADGSKTMGGQDHHPVPKGKNFFLQAVVKFPGTSSPCICRRVNLSSRRRRQRACHRKRPSRGAPRSPGHRGRSRCCPGNGPGVECDDLQCADPELLAIGECLPCTSRGVPYVVYLAPVSRESSMEPERSPRSGGSRKSPLS